MEAKLATQKIGLFVVGSKKTSGGCSPKAHIRLFYTIAFISHMIHATAPSLYIEEHVAICWKRPIIFGYNQFQVISKTSYILHSWKDFFPIIV